MSKIEWTESTWNPTSGCDKISQGCKFCYAEQMSRRLKAMGQAKYANGFKLTLHPKELEKPFTWKKRRTIFVDSMSDLFHSDVPVEYIQKVFKVMNDTPQHTYQVLTKRSENLNSYDLHGDLSWSNNIWIGVSVEDTKVLDRIHMLAMTRAHIKFLSCEPLIEDIADHDDFDLSGIDWVIVGGESGNDPRECKLEWIEAIVEKCQALHIPVFVKQMGTVLSKKLGLANRHGKDINEFPQHLRIREYPNTENQ